MSARSNPFEELERFFERMSRQFDGASRMWESEGPLGRWTEFDSMSIDLVERDDEFVVTVDLPGFENDDVDVRVTNQTLRIEAEREEIEDETEDDIEDETEQYLRHERRHESMHRSIRLPGEVDKESVSARMKNGVLTVTLPRIETEEAREIDIEE